MLWQVRSSAALKGYSVMRNDASRINLLLDQTVPAQSLKLKTMLGLSRAPLETVTDLARRHGPIVRIPLPRMCAYLVSDPVAITEILAVSDRSADERIGSGRQALNLNRFPLGRLIGQAMINASGPQRQEHRRLTQSLYMRGHVREYAETFARTAEEQATGWVAGEPVDIYRELARVGLLATGRTLLRRELAPDLSERILDAFNTTLRCGWRAAVPGGAVLDRLPLRSTRRWAAAAHELEQIAAGLINERFESPFTNGPELISLLSRGHGRNLGSDRPADRDRHLRDELLTVLFAGHETLASALSWSLLLLAEHPEVRERMRHELVGVLRGRLPGSGDIDALAYTSAVFKEALRLYSPSWLIFRRLTEPREVCGYTLPAGAVTLFSAWVVHHDALWWPQPDEFKPERWLADGDSSGVAGAAVDDAAIALQHGRTSRQRDAFFPFGGAPRQCPGKSFAEVEGVVVLAVLNSLWNLDPVIPGLPEPRVGITLRPPAQVLMVPQGLPHRSSAADAGKTRTHEDSRP